jgi:micrococcal nuclease
LGRRKITPKYSIGSLLLLLAFAFYIACNRDAEQKPQNGYIEKPAVEKKAKKAKYKKELRHLTVFEGKVVGIKDGDTFEVLYEGQPEKVRLAELDCPEKKQPLGNYARDYASQLCFGKMVTVSSSGKRDRYGRVVGTITTEEGINVNEALIRAGLAWHYKDYSKNKELGLLQQEAKTQKIGLWQDKNPVAPWNWRKHKRKMSQKKKETEVVINE